MQCTERCRKRRGLCYKLRQPAGEGICASRRGAHWFDAGRDVLAAGLVEDLAGVRVEGVVYQIILDLRNIGTDVFRLDSSHGIARTRWNHMDSVKTALCPWTGAGSMSAPSQRCCPLGRRRAAEPDMPTHAQHKTVKQLESISRPCSDNPLRASI